MQNSYIPTLAAFFLTAFAVLVLVVWGPNASALVGVVIHRIVAVLGELQIFVKSHIQLKRSKERLLEGGAPVNAETRARNLHPGVY
jgi:hypothetical protein